MYVENERGEETPGSGGCLAWCGSGALEKRRRQELTMVERENEISRKELGSS